MKTTQIRQRCFRVEHRDKWAIVRFNGSEWLSELAFYQRIGSRGKVVKPMSKRHPRYKRIGFFNNLKDAMTAAKNTILPDTKFTL